MYATSPFLSPGDLFFFFFCRTILSPDDKTDRATRWSAVHAVTVKYQVICVKEYIFGLLCSFLTTEMSKLDTNGQCMVGIEQFITVFSLNDRTEDNRLILGVVRCDLFWGCSFHVAGFHLHFVQARFQNNNAVNLSFRTVCIQHRNKKKQKTEEGSLRDSVMSGQF